VGSDDIEVFIIESYGLSVQILEAVFALRALHDFGVEARAPFQ